MFSGHVDDQRWQGDVYLSLIEDYRKLSGVYSEQIIARTGADSMGYFEFSGDQLENAYRIYRIHVDNCENGFENSNHFSGHCPDSKEVLFIARNTDTIQFPFSFDKQMFCELESSNPKAMALMQIDSLKEEMRFAFGEFRSEANRKLNSRKWISTMQEFSKNLDEPLAELYTFAFISERGSDLYNFYLNDLVANDFYINLEDRLNSVYPNSTYTNQFSNEIAADKYSINRNDSGFLSRELIYTLLGISLLGNVFLLFRIRKNKRKRSSGLRSDLTQQENKILDQLLSDLSNKDIAEANFVSVSTVKTHVNNIYRKLKVQSRNEVKALFKK
ncbi:MAG: helix-turn-helix transcriptional regulator [Flavobacteriaceae bacterium]|nr:helix-turn-helix transcriptional regulator [Flavobacteriaceae bacterium]